MKKLKAAYKADPKSPETRKLEADYCRNEGPESTAEMDALNANVNYNNHVNPDLGISEETMRVVDLNMQEVTLTSRSIGLREDLRTLGITCPSAPPAQAETLAKSDALRTAKPSAENPIKGQMMLVVLFVAGLALYFLPSLVGDKKANRWAIFMLNLLAGWTIVGWIIAMVWACSSEPSEKPVLSHSTSPAMGHNAFCGHCGSPVTTAFCRNCGHRADL